MKKLFFTLISLLGFHQIQAQQEAMYSQYMFNPMAINPAQTGKITTPEINVIYRKQWLGADFEGDPQVQSVIGVLPMKNEKMSLGFQLFNDIAGVLKSTGGMLNYAYKVQLNNNNTSLSMGIQAGATNFRACLTCVNTSASNDPNFSQNTNKFLPNVGAGVYLSNQRFYLGLSVPQFIPNDLSLTETSNSANQNKQIRYYFGEIGYRARLNRHISIEPSTLVKMIENAPPTFDFNLKFELLEKLTLGTSYRTSNQQFREASRNVRLGDLLVGFLQVQASPKIQFGYAYNAPTGMQGQIGSHEIMLKYRFTKASDDSIIIDPRNL
ncbi:MAG: type IX secretion system membrane protein PorP/SprF [Arcicella sp.]|nr:type IX secretion system membrane protein PorP/SprF [Arcicella sp.]